MMKGKGRLPQAKRRAKTKGKGQRQRQGQKGKDKGNESSPTTRAKTKGNDKGKDKGKAKGKDKGKTKSCSKVFAKDQFMHGSGRLTRLIGKGTKMVAVYCDDLTVIHGHRVGLDKHHPGKGKGKSFALVCGKGLSFGYSSEYRDFLNEQSKVDHVYGADIDVSGGDFLKAPSDEGPVIGGKFLSQGVGNAEKVEPQPGHRVEG